MRSREATGRAGGVERGVQRRDGTLLRVDVEPRRARLRQHDRGPAVGGEPRAVPRKRRRPL
jgi:hypothetical protein